MIIEPTLEDVGDVAGRLLAAAEDPGQVRTVSGERGVAFDVPDQLADKAGFGAKKPATKRATKKPTQVADTNT